MPEEGADLNAGETLSGIAHQLGVILSFEDDLINAGDTEGEAAYLHDVLEQIGEIAKELAARGY